MVTSSRKGVRPVAAHHVEGLEDAEAALVNDGYDVVRVGYSDLIGSERGRDVLVRGFARTVGDGSPSAEGSTARPPWGDVSRSRAA
jgi:glutamine synthetase